MNTYTVPGKLKFKKKQKSAPAAKRLLKSGLQQGPKTTNYEKLATVIQKEILKTKDEGTGEGEETTTIEIEPQAVAPKRTPAEIAFHKRQAELQARRVFEKAQSSHREKVEQFNEHMETLTEFNDIPKVSWTK